MRKPESDAVCVGLLMALAASWRMVEFARADPDTALLVLAMPLILFLVAAAFGFYAFIGWAFVRFVLPILLRAVDAPEAKGKYTWPLVLGSVAAVFLGFPAISDAFKWWHENIFSRIPVEKAFVESAINPNLKWIDDHFNDIAEYVLGIAFFTMFGWKHINNAGRYLYQTSATIRYIVREIIANRNWSILIFSLYSLAGTVLIALFAKATLFWNLSLLEVAWILVWLFLPILRIVILIFLFIAGGTALGQLGKSVSDLSGGYVSGSFAFLIGIFIWIAWMVTGFQDKSLRLRLAFWAVSLAVVACVAFSIHTGFPPNTKISM
jgi:hypothetical protein